MEEIHNTAQMPRVKLGTQGFAVSKLGFGCMSLSGSYNFPVSDKVGISIVKHAFNMGITFFDTSDMYGPHTNEILIGKALKKLPREKIQLATKFGVKHVDGNGMAVDGKPEYVRACYEASLERLGVDYIDLYYQHRIDKATPVEETVNFCLGWRVEEVGGRGESEVHWVVGSKPRYNQASTCSASYHSLADGMVTMESRYRGRDCPTLQASHPRFVGENLEKNKPIYARVEKLAAKHQCTSAQLALAWVLHQGVDVVPIPGTTKMKNLDDNVGSLKVRLTEDDQKEISDAVSAEEVAGERVFKFSQAYTWQNAKTPLPGSKAST